MRLAQLHGDEDPEYCRAVGAERESRAFRAASEFSDQAGDGVSCRVPLLLDAYDPRLAWRHRPDRSTGQMAARRRPRAFASFLAGGLGPANIREAVRSRSAPGRSISTAASRAPQESGQRRS
jgi:phosphoribosylanthranilate isomerase